MNVSQCLIDLKRNLLVIGTTGQTTPFLPEGELPDCARLSGPRSESENSSVIEMEDRELAKALEESNAASTATANLPTDPDAVLPSDKFKEADVLNLVSMGFTRPQVNINVIFNLQLRFLSNIDCCRLWKSCESLTETLPKQRQHYLPSLLNFDRRQYVAVFLGGISQAVQGFVSFL